MPVLSDAGGRRGMSGEICGLMTTDKPRPLELFGKVVTGLGQGAGFTELEHAKKQFLAKLGIDAWPGTLNLKVEDAAAMADWRSLKDNKGIDIIDPDGNHCKARSYPIRINNRITGAIIFPEIANYPANQVEIIAPVSLRRYLVLNDGDQLKLTVIKPIEVSAILFDLDGTLVDTVRAFYLLAKLTGEEFGLEMIESRVYDTLNHGISYWEHVLPSSMEDHQSMIDKLNNRAMQLWPGVLKDNASVLPGVYETLSKLKAAGYTLGIVTSSRGKSLELLYQLGVAGLFDAVITGADVEKRKPDPEGLVKCLDILDVAPNDAIYVGDSVIDMQASHAAGVLPVGVLTGAGNSPTLCEAGAYRTIPSHEQLADLLTTR